MATPSPNPVEAGVQANNSYVPPTAWGMVQIAVLAVLAATLALAIVVHALHCIANRRKAKAKNAELENAVAELGAERERASALQGALNRRDAFIDRNVLQGPEAFCARTPPAVVRKSCEASGGVVSAAARKSYETTDKQSYESTANDVFVVGSYNSNYDKEEAARRRAIAAQGGVRPAPAPVVVQEAVRIQPSQIRTVTVPPPKRVVSPKRGRVEEQVSLPSKRAKIEEADSVGSSSPPPEGSRSWWNDTKQGETSTSTQPAPWGRSPPPPRGSLRAELDRYWRDNNESEDEEEEDDSAEVDKTGRGNSVDKGKEVELTQVSL